MTGHWVYLPLYIGAGLILFVAVLRYWNRHQAAKKLKMATKYRNELVGQMAEVQEEVIKNKME